LERSTTRDQPRGRTRRSSRSSQQSNLSRSREHVHRCKAKGEKWTEILQSHRHSLAHCAPDRGRGKKGEQGSQRRLAHSAASDVAFTGASRESSGSGTLGVAVLGQGRSTQFSRPAPSHLAWYPRLSSIHRSQPLCSSEHPPKTPGPIGLSPPKNGRSGLVHPGTDDRQAAPSAEYYYTPRSHTYEQISPERHEYAFHFGRD